MRGACHLDHRDFGRGRLVADLVHHVRCLEAEQARHLDVDARLGDALFPDADCSEIALAEGDARLQPLAHASSAFGDADRAHAMMDAARAEAALRDLEAAALAEQQISAGTRTFSSSPRHGRAARRHSRRPAACV
jgi:hypothetical protein